MIASINNIKKRNRTLAITTIANLPTNFHFKRTKARKTGLLVALLATVGIAMLNDTARGVVTEVPLGNLFDDTVGTDLETAIASDTYQAGAATTDLGVHTVIGGGLNVAQTIAPGVIFNLGVNAGGSAAAFGGAPSNDTRWGTSNTAIRTTGTSATLGTTKIDDGVGMHANNLITFDLGALRDAGTLSATPSYFTARNGINDSANTTNPDLNTAFIVSDASGNVLAGYLNGEKIGVTKTAGVWTFDSGPAKGFDGAPASDRLAELAVPLSPSARYLTLATTNKGDGNSDHGVFSDANWEPYAVPLSNLFGDGAGTSLVDAIATDPRAQTASASDRFVDKAQAGGMGGVVTIAGIGGSAVDFDLSTAGATSTTANRLPSNDTFEPDTFTGRAIQTRGADAVALTTTGVIEDGIGMHANALVTFDLDEIRSSGSFGSDLWFRAKAGINDSAATADDLRTVVIVSDDSGSVLNGFINGIEAGGAFDILLSGSTWGFTGTIPGEVAGNTFHDYNVYLGANAAFLTLATTSGDLNSDHGVFSGARLVGATIPEPSTFALLWLGLFSLGLVRWRRRRRA